MEIKRLTKPYPALQVAEDRSASKLAEMLRPAAAIDGVERNLPNNALRSGANGLQVLVALEDSEAGVADLNGVEVWVARRCRHGGGWRRVGHGPPLPGDNTRLSQKDDKIVVRKLIYVRRRVTKKCPFSNSGVLKKVPREVGKVYDILTTT